MAFDELQGEVASRVAGSSRVMALLEDFTADLDVIGDVELSSDITSNANSYELTLIRSNSG